MTAPKSLFDVLDSGDLAKAAVVTTDPSHGHAPEGAMGFGAMPHTQMPVPWQFGGPNAMKEDWDHDGIPNALDHYYGPGAYPPGT